MIEIITASIIRVKYTCVRLKLRQKNLEAPLTTPFVLAWRIDQLAMELEEPNSNCTSRATCGKRNEVNNSYSCCQH